jgi:hypothetical protein
VVGWTEKRKCCRTVGWISDEKSNIISEEEIKIDIKETGCKKGR